MNWSMRKAKTRKTSEFPGETGSLVCNEYITPMIIKYPFWVMTYENELATYACLNYEEACCPEKLKERSILIGGDTGAVFRAMLR